MGRCGCLALPNALQVPVPSHVWAVHRDAGVISVPSIVGSTVSVTLVGRNFRWTSTALQWAVLCKSDLCGWGGWNFWTVCFTKNTQNYSCQQKLARNNFTQKKKLDPKHCSWNEILVWPQRKSFIQVNSCLFWGSWKFSPNICLLPLFSHFASKLSAQFCFTLFFSFFTEVKNLPVNHQQHQNPINCLVVQSSISRTHTPTGSSCYHLQTSPVIWAAWAHECWTTNLGLSTHLFKSFLCFPGQQQMCSDCRYNATCGCV